MFRTTRRLAMLGLLSLLGVLATATTAGATEPTTTTTSPPPTLPDASETADAFMTTHSPEAVAIILSVAGAAILIGLIAMGVRRVRATLVKGR